MIILALDLSKRSTGFAAWGEGMRVPAFGHWTLGSEITEDGRTYAKLHECLDGLHALVRFTHIYREEAINPANLSGVTNINSLRLAAGLDAHVESYAYARSCRTRRINVGSWRKDFIGSDLVAQANGDARRKRKLTGKGSARDKLKRLSIERCRMLGFSPANDDEAEALGILTYACGLNQLTPPWLANEVLRPLSEVAG